MRHGSSCRGFSLVEAMAAAVILSITVVSIFASLSSLQKPVKDNGDSLKAAYCGQQFLEDMRAQVDQRNWGAVGNLLTPGTYTINAGSTPSLSSYAACTALGATAINVTVTSPVGGYGARKMQIQVIWP